MRDPSHRFTFGVYGHDPKQFHYGLVGQEFFAAFGSDGIGTIGTPTTINSGDMAGILMIAAQALEHRAGEQRSVIETLRAENAVLQNRLQSLETVVRAREALTQRAGWKRTANPIAAKESRND